MVLQSTSRSAFFSDAFKPTLPDALSKFVESFFRYFSLRHAFPISSESRSDLRSEERRVGKEIGILLFSLMITSLPGSTSCGLTLEREPESIRSKLFDVSTIVQSDRNSAKTAELSRFPVKLRGCFNNGAPINTAQCFLLRRC